MGLLQRLFGSGEQHSQYNSTNRFIVEEPWQWPDNSEYDFDSYDDADRRYNFAWSNVPDDQEIMCAYRDKVKPYTHLVIVTTPESEYNSDFISYASGMQVLFDGDEQVFGQIRSYEYNGKDNDLSTIDVEIECYANTYDMTRTLQDDLCKSHHTVEYLGDSVTGRLDR